MSLLMISAIANFQPVQAPGSQPTWTPEAVLITIGFGIIVVLLSIVAWLGKKMLNDILKNQKEYLSRQTSCRETLADRFAEKIGTSDHIKELYARTDRHESVLTRHMVLLGDRSGGNGLNG